MMETVSITPVFMWHCEKCGEPRLSSGVVISDTKVKDFVRPEKVKEATGPEGVWVHGPLTVKCRTCNSEFRTREMAAEENDTPEIRKAIDALQRFFRMRETPSQ